MDGGEEGGGGGIRSNFPSQTVWEESERSVLLLDFELRQAKLVRRVLSGNGILPYFNRFELSSES